MASKIDPVKYPNFKCRKCKTNDKLTYYKSSGDYEDYHYFCGNCKYDWWVEGSDS